MNIMRCCCGGGGPWYDWWPIEAACVVRVTVNSNSLDRSSAAVNWSASKVEYAARYRSEEYASRLAPDVDRYLADDSQFVGRVLDAFAEIISTTSTTIDGTQELVWADTFPDYDGGAWTFWTWSNRRFYIYVDVDGLAYTPRVLPTPTISSEFLSAPSAPYVREWISIPTVRAVGIVGKFTDYSSPPAVTITETNAFVGEWTQDDHPHVSTSIVTQNGTGSYTPGDADRNFPVLTRQEHRTVDWGVELLNDTFGEPTKHLTIANGNGRIYQLSTGGERASGFGWDAQELLEYNQSGGVSPAHPVLTSISVRLVANVSGVGDIEVTDPEGTANGTAPNCTPARVPVNDDTFPPSAYKSTTKVGTAIFTTNQVDDPGCREQSAWGVVVPDALVLDPTLTPALGRPQVPSFNRLRRWRRASYQIFASATLSSEWSIGTSNDARKYPGYDAAAGQDLSNDPWGISANEFAVQNKNYNRRMPNILGNINFGLDRGPVADAGLIAFAAGDAPQAIGARVTALAYSSTEQATSGNQTTSISVPKSTAELNGTIELVRGPMTSSVNGEVLDSTSETTGSNKKPFIIHTFQSRGQGRRWICIYTKNSAVTSSSDTTTESAPSYWFKSSFGNKELGTVDATGLFWDSEELPDIDPATENDDYQQYADIKLDGRVSLGIGSVGIFERGALCDWAFVRRWTQTGGPQTGADVVLMKGMDIVGVHPLGNAFAFIKSVTDNWLYIDDGFADLMISSETGVMKDTRIEVPAKGTTVIGVAGPSR